MATNRKIGNSFETEFCELLFQHGFWCHNMAQNAAGQPADVIAVKGKTAYLIDCKVWLTCSACSTLTKLATARNTRAGTPITREHGVRTREQFLCPRRLKISFV